MADLRVEAAARAMAKVDAAPFPWPMLTDGTQATYLRRAEAALAAADTAVELDLADPHRERYKAALEKIRDEEEAIMFRSWDHYYEWVQGIVTAALDPKAEESIDA